jgi:hypothetical protein
MFITGRSPADNLNTLKGTMESHLPGNVALV